MIDWNFQIIRQDSLHSEIVIEIKIFEKICVVDFLLHVQDEFLY